MCFGCQISSLNLVNAVFEKVQGMERSLNELAKQYSDLKMIIASYENSVSNLSSKIDKLGSDTKISIGEIRTLIVSNQVHLPVITEMQKTIAQLKHELESLKSQKPPPSNRLPI